MRTTYSHKLRHPLWQEKRLNVFKRDSFSCTNCKSNQNELQLHHLDYLPGIDPWEYPDDMLTTLCYKCHELEIGRLKVEKALITTLKMKGFLLSDLLSLSCYLDNDIDFTKTLLKALRDNENEKSPRFSILCF